jgi:hypothetical protein
MMKKSAKEESHNQIWKHRDKILDFLFYISANIFVMAFIFKVLELKGYKIWFIIYAHALNFEYTTTTSYQKLNLIRPIKVSKDKSLYHC